MRKQDRKPKKEKGLMKKNSVIEYFDVDPFMNQKTKKTEKQRAKNKEPKESKKERQEGRKKEQERDREREIEKGGGKKG